MNNLYFDKPCLGSWTEDEAQIIQMVKESGIYDERDSQDIVFKKMRLWNSISEKIKLPRHVCEFRWNSIFRKYLTARSRFRVKGIPIDKKKYDCLKFLDDASTTTTRKKRKLTNSQEDLNDNCGLEYSSIGIITSTNISQDDISLLTKQDKEKLNNKTVTLSPDNKVQNLSLNNNTTHNIDFNINEILESALTTLKNSTNTERRVTQNVPILTKKLPPQVPLENNICTTVDPSQNNSIQNKDIEQYMLLPNKETALFALENDMLKTKYTDDNSTILVEKSKIVTKLADTVSSKLKELNSFKDSKITQKHTKETRKLVQQTNISEIWKSIDNELQETLQNIPLDNNKTEKISNTINYRTETLKSLLERKPSKLLSLNDLSQNTNLNVSTSTNSSISVKKSFMLGKNKRCQPKTAPSQRSKLHPNKNVISNLTSSIYQKNFPQIAMNAGQSLKDFGNLELRISKDIDLKIFDADLQLDAIKVDKGMEDYQNIRIIHKNTELENIKKVGKVIKKQENLSFTIKNNTTFKHETDLQNEAMNMQVNISKTFENIQTKSNEFLTHPFSKPLQDNDPSNIIIDAEIDDTQYADFGEVIYSNGPDHKKQIDLDFNKSQDSFFKNINDLEVLPFFDEVYRYASTKNECEQIGIQNSILTIIKSRIENISD